MKNPIKGQIDISVWWKHRRRMAYVSLAWCIIQTIAWVTLEFKNPGIMAGLSTVIGWSYGTASTVIIGYFGNTALDSYRSKDSPPATPSAQTNESPNQNTEKKPWETGI